MAFETIVGLKELRNDLERYTKQVRRGKSLIIVRRSKPLFKIVPVDEEGEWESIVDFTEFYKEGIPAKKLLLKLLSLDEKTR